ncbi:MAG: hypothetical protein KF703_10320 [Actinobacteria bacterium]|nr:hypothetical protein [Actinomycetota bacterium]
MPERHFAPPAWVAALVAGALLGGLATLLDAWSQVAADQSQASRRGAVALALGLVALVAAAPEAVAHVKATRGGRRRLAAAAGFAAFDVFLVVTAWRWRRGILIPMPEPVVVLVGLTSLVLLVVSVRSSGGRQAGHAHGRGEWG